MHPYIMFIETNWIQRNEPNDIRSENDLIPDKRSWIFLIFSAQNKKGQNEIRIKLRQCYFIYLLNAYTQHFYSRIRCFFFLFSQYCNEHCGFSISGVKYRRKFHPKKGTKLIKITERLERMRKCICIRYYIRTKARKRTGSIIEDIFSMSWYQK